MSKTYEKKINFFNSFPLLKDWRLLLYNITIVLFSPYLLATKFRRFRSRKNRSAFARYRWNTPVHFNNEENQQALHVVFVAMGFGEKQTAEQLASALKKVRPNVRTTLAVKEDVTFNSIRETNPSQSVTNVPFDFWPPVSRWLKKMDLDVIVSVEKLWIPNIIWGAKIQNSSVCVVSGRSSRFKGKGLQIWHTINRWTLQGYDLIGLMSEDEKQKLNGILPHNKDIRVTGTSKLIQHKEEHSSFEQLARWIQFQNQADLPILAAGSIHPGEEEKWILDAYDKVRQTTPCILLFAPRRLDRIHEILETFQNRGLKVSRRSKFSSDSDYKNADVLLLDSMGELSTVYRFAHAAYVGGTLRAPGHNIFEPIEWRVPVFFGPGNENVPLTQTIALTAGAGFRIHSPHSLAEHWKEILNNPQLLEKLRQRCDLVTAEQEQSLQNSLQIILDTIDIHLQRSH